MRWRAVALASLGINVVLALGWLGLRRPATESRAPAPAVTGQAAPGSGGTNIVVRRQFFSWHELESDDYPTYIANLRDIACPEQTIRDIIIADVNALYARKRAQEIMTPAQQWWRTEPDTNVLQAAIQKVRELEQQRRDLLVRLLGTNWESGDLVNLPRPSHEGVILDGPQLGALAPETKQAIQEVNARSTDRMQAYLEAQRAAGKVPDPVELAKLRQQTRDDLARVLSPPQLEEFLLRYSQNAGDLRAELGQLGFFNVTSNEFLMLFRATDNLDQQIQLLSGNDPNTVAQRNSLDSARENAIKLALGPSRYGAYRDLQDPLYRQSMAQAIQAGTPEAAATIYQINLAAQAEQDSIRSDTNLTASQRSVELKQLELDQLQANTLATDQELPPEPPPMPPAVPQRTYVIHSGDTAAVVSMIYGVPVSALRQVNPALNLNRLRPGDSLIIPSTQLPPGAAP
ncbi:MAG: LysM peptidoglycan-binding domain-containing protein [Verrucomicrobiota bacterium]|jgi:LysM repeat protein